MKQGMQLSLRPQLAMTLHLQQAIALLSLPAGELSLMMEKEYEENPLLEWAEEDGTEEMESFPQDFAGASCPIGEKAAGPTLTEVLQEQLDLLLPAGKMLHCTRFLAASLDARGYVCTPLSELAKAVGASQAEMAAALNILQGLDPAGIGARNLQECLLLQAKRQGKATPLLLHLVQQYLPEIAQGDYQEIAHHEQVPLVAVQQAVEILQAFDPKPGSRYSSGPAQYIQPDVIIFLQEGAYQIKVGTCGQPSLRLSVDSWQRFRQQGVSAAYLRQCHQRAQWFLQSLERRRQTLFQVAAELVLRQRAFLKRGPGFLQPLQRKTVAKALGLHPSTVGRAVSGKYALTPQGMVPLSAFFPAPRRMYSGQVWTEREIGLVLTKILQAEDDRHPFSDRRLQELLENQGMRLARRTVMKYRERLGIPSSQKRKRP